MRMLTAVIGVLGIFASATAVAQDSPPPAAGQSASTDPSAATTPPPAETAPPPPALAAPGAPARAQVGPADAPTGPSLWGILPWGGYGIGARYMIPVPITQILTRTRFRDYWALEVGADLLHFNYDYAFGTTGFSYSWTEVIPVVGMMWQVWLTDDFAVYPKVELGYAFGWYSDTNGTMGSLQGGNHFFPDGTAGLLYKIGNGLTLRAEAGYVGGKGGIAWLF